MPFKGEVVENEKHTKDVHVLKIHFPELENFSYLPGQFAVLVPNGAGRAYSIANYPSNGYLEFCIKKVPQGKVSPVLCSMEPGEKLEIYAPFGEFVLRHPLERDIIFVCSGTGIAPIKAMIESVIKNEKENNTKKVILVYGCRESEYPYKTFIEKVKEKGIRVFITQDVAKTLQNFKSLKNFEAYICGSPFFVRDVIRICKAKGAEKINYEKYIFSDQKTVIEKLCKKG